MVRRFVALVLLGLVVVSAAQAQSAFYTVDGKDIVPPAGAPKMVRGIGLGGWLMPESYMIRYRFGGKRDITAAVRDLIGEADTQEFWRLYRQYYVQEKDIAALAQAGFDHVRLPFHYDVVYDYDSRTFKPEGFELFDTFIEWCRKYGLYVILDLHGAPGAQSDGGIADSDGEARLWTERDPHWGMTAAIWGEIARRYRDETQIIGYDLLNEPVTPDEIGDGAQALRDLYELLVLAVRSSDPNHIVFIEGNYWATTFDKLTPPFDDKLVYSFHKYWNPTDTGTIAYLLGIRDTYDVPLWLGETGENSNMWALGMIDLMAEHDIPWNWWTHKKVAYHTSPWSVPMPDAYRRVTAYWNGSAARPTVAEAREGLFGLARALDLDSARFNPDMLAVLTDPDFGARKPYVDHVLPGVVNAVDYDTGLQGVTYFDTDYQTVQGGAGTGNTGERYRNDGVDIEESTDPEGFDFNVGWLEPGEWMEYTVYVETAGTYDVDIRVASQSGGRTLELLVDYATEEVATVPATGGWQTWRSVTVRGLRLGRGTHRLRLTVGQGGGAFNLNRLTFDLVEADPDQAEPRPELYPLPARTEVTLRLPASAAETARVWVHDTLGRERGSWTFDLQTDGRAVRLDTARWPSGVYGYRIEMGDRVWTGQLVVMR